MPKKKKKKCSISFPHFKEFHCLRFSQSSLWLLLLGISLYCATCIALCLGWELYSGVSRYGMSRYFLPYLFAFFLHDWKAGFQVAQWQLFSESIRWTL
jgi:hypothetical protein